MIHFLWPNILVNRASFLLQCPPCRFLHALLEDLLTDLIAVSTSLVGSSAHVVEHINTDVVSHLC